MAAQQLNGHGGPERIALGASRMQACGARSPARHDARSDLDAVACQHDGQVGGIRRGQRRRAPGREQTRDEDESRRCGGVATVCRWDAGAAVIGVTAIAAAGDADRRARESDDTPVGVGDVSAELESDQGWPLPVDQRGTDGVDERTHLGETDSVLSREERQQSLGDAPRERAQQSLLPRRQVIETNAAVVSELQAGRCTPQRRCGGGEAQHVSILRMPRHRGQRSPQPPDARPRGARWGGADASDGAGALGSL